ncbi:aminotransferase class I/II-fold pyridoxal phosphate-dependent enzyme [Sphingomonas sp. Leaf343]|uniref:aminotransferase class I/II-fold pyridoxal phosphate-dependent enzyme n=1 Tax=Sphingomonas sp. Leaf343 TaxID=1736345 RepID=UPI000A8FA701|nr:aminotransferase class I/II-fold pyridoxal phosphate-dependent enzyme [Sphingomonas sp. Leaf343]
MDAARVPIATFAEHGGRIDRARAAIPAVRDWIDLSTGLAPWSYPAQVDAAMLERLPDPAALAVLGASAAAAFGSDPARTVAVPGSDLALRLLGTLLPGPAAVLGRGYSGHAAMWASPPERVDAPEDCAADTLVLARPNNPDGAMVPVERLRRDGMLIVDEAFVEATPDESLAGADWPTLIVLRSFGKFYGLAGLRLGFVIAPEPVCVRLRHRLGDWPIGSAAVAIGTAAYRDVDWQAAQRDRLRVAADRLDALLTGAGLTIAGGTPFFRLVETPARDALFAHLLTAGILTRPFTDRPHHLRLGLPRDGDWPKLTGALARWSGS